MWLEGFYCLVMVKSKMIGRLEGCHNFWEDKAEVFVVKKVDN
jgi:hypothetical protein